MKPFVHDLWAPLNHRSDMGDGLSRPPNVPGWVADHDARRMAAYRICAAYLDNATRYYLPDILWQRPTAVVTRDAIAATVEIGKSPAEKFREYGDPRLLVDQAVALLLGDKQEIVVPDAVAVPEDAVDETKAQQARAAQFADWLADWADTERLFLRMFEQEDDTVGIGDGVLVLGWDAEADRPRLRKYDAESYFPVLTGDQDADEFPNRVHFAWVEQKPGQPELLHRLTYDRRRLPAGQTARYAYADKPSSWAVYQTHATWQLRDVKGTAGLYDLSDRAATYLSTPDGTPIQDLPLGIDFMPVIHIPNTPTGGQHFGKSLLLSVAQLLDDVAFADSDLAASSEVVGNTPVVTTGGGVSGPLDRGPGGQWNLAAGQDAKLLDTSNVLTGQMKYSDHLRSMLSVNARLAEALLGRIKPNEVPSGYALGLGFAPTKSLIEKMRLVRGEKHPLIPKFAMRLAQVNGVLPAGETPRAEISLGPYLPADVAAVVEQVKGLLGAHAISRHTAVQMLVNMGLPIEDAEGEVDRIKAELFTDAVALLEATGDETAVRAFLGLEGDAPAATPPTSPTSPHRPSAAAPASPAPPGGGAGTGGGVGTGQPG